MECLNRGYKFSSFEEVQKALLEYQKQTGVEFVIRDGRRLEVSHARKVDTANKAIIYSHVKLCCVRGGRDFISRSKGNRNRKTWKTGCKSQIKLRYTECAQYLEISYINLSHNHKVEPRPLKREEARAEKRILRIMNRLKISYEDAKKIDIIHKSIKNGRMSNETREISSNEESDCVTAAENEDLFEDNDSLSMEEYDLHQPTQTYITKIDSCYLKAANYMEANTNLQRKTYKKIEDNKNVLDDCHWSATFNGKKKFKDDNIFETLGTIEELSSSIGFAVEFIPEDCQSIKKELREIQCVLHEMAIHVGSPKSCHALSYQDGYHFPDSYIIKLESLIEKHKSVLPELKCHVLPSGGKSSSTLHVARTVCRRAERRVIGLVREQEVDNTAMLYLNRLGDYLFIAARIACLTSGNTEHIYTKLDISSDDFQSLEVVYLNQQDDL